MNPNEYEVFILASDDATKLSSWAVIIATLAWDRDIEWEWVANDENHTRSLHVRAPRVISSTMRAAFYGADWRIVNAS